MKKTTIFLLASFMFITGMGPAETGQTGRQPYSPFEVDSLINTKAPDFALRDMNGNPVTLSLLRGKVVLLNFWATWCPPCKAEMDSFNRLYQRLRPRGLEIIAISTDKTVGAVKDYLAKNRLDFTIAYDEAKSVTKQYRVFTMPTTFLIDRNGTVVERFFGEYDWMAPDMIKKLEKY